MSMKKLYLILVYFFLVAFSLTAKDVPFLSGRIVDEAGILSNNTIRELEEALRKHEESTSNQIAVLVISSLDDEVLEQYSLKVVETWKLGKKGRDNGVLLLVAITDRKMRIEVGYGLEGDLTDAMCRRIIRNELTPEFRRGNYDAGISAGVMAIMSVIEGSYVGTQVDDSEYEILSWQEQVLIGIFVMSILGLFTFFGIFLKGCAGWFMFFFLIPFYAIFPAVIFGFDAGMNILAAYVVGFIVLKVFFQHTAPGKELVKKMPKIESSGGGSLGSGTWSSSGRSSGWSSGGSSWSGGGGSFGGGGSSGSW